MSGAENTYLSGSEVKVLESLRPRFENLGYHFISHPRPSMLPDFMAGYIPDAIAVRDNDSIAIEVKGPAMSQSERLVDLQSRFKDQPNWRLALVTGGIESLDGVQIPVPRVELVRRGIKNVERHLRNKDTAAALVMSFALLEAAFKVASNVGEGRPNQPGEVIQSLAVAGLIDTADERHLRSLLDRRNKVIHGDLGVEVAPDQPRFVLTIIEKVLTTAFAA